MNLSFFSCYLALSLIVILQTSLSTISIDEKVQSTTGRRERRGKAASTNKKSKLHYLNFERKTQLGNDSVECALFEENSTDDVRCMPSFIVAGTQKSGTTALAALLSDHPSIVFSLKKEVHFFDKARNYKNGKDSYIKAFRPWNMTSSLESSTGTTMGGAAALYPPVFGEATPSYIASRHGCKRIAKMLPEVKIIIMVRDPVKRAYSEYQMKKRREENQEEYLMMLRQHEKRFYECLSVKDDQKQPQQEREEIDAVKQEVNNKKEKKNNKEEGHEEEHYDDNNNTGVTINDIRKCLPKEIVRNSKWPKLKKALEKAYDKLDSWVDVRDLCFPARNIERQQQQQQQTSDSKNYLLPTTTTTNSDGNNNCYPTMNSSQSSTTPELSNFPWKNEKYVVPAGVNAHSAPITSTCTTRYTSHIGTTPHSSSPSHSSSSSSSNSKSNINVVDINNHNTNVEMYNHNKDETDHENNIHRLKSISSSNKLSKDNTAVAAAVAATTTISGSREDHRRLDALSCWSYNLDGFEVLKPLQEAMVEEIRSFRECAGSLLDPLLKYNNDSLYGEEIYPDNFLNEENEVEEKEEEENNPSVIEKRNNNNNNNRNKEHNESEQDYDEEEEEEYSALFHSLENINRAINKCIRVKAGISTQYFYRSMYAVQLHHCFQWIPQEHFLVIPTERLRLYPDKVMEQILSFIGIPPLQQQQQQQQQQQNSSNIFTNKGNKHDDDNSNINNINGVTDEESTTVAVVSADGRASTDAYISSDIYKEQQQQEAEQRQQQQQQQEEEQQEEEEQKSMVESRKEEEEEEDTECKSISCKISEQFPTFEKSTGWRLESVYEEIPADIAAYMKEFFEYQNNLLFELVGENFEQEW